MVVGAAGADAETVMSEAGGDGLGVSNNLCGVFLELRFQRFAEAGGFRGDDVHERAALDAGEDLGVNFFGKLLFAKDDAAAWTAQGFVGCGGNEIGVWHGAGVDTGGDEARDVCHIDKEVGTDLAGEFSHAFEIDDA